MYKYTICVFNGNRVIETVRFMKWSKYDIAQIKENNYVKYAISKEEKNNLNGNIYKIKAN